MQNVHARCLLECGLVEAFKRIYGFKFTLSGCFGWFSRWFGWKNSRYDGRLRLRPLQYFFDSCYQPEFLSGTKAMKVVGIDWPYHSSAITLIQNVLGFDPDGLFIVVTEPLATIDGVRSYHVIILEVTRNWWRQWICAWKDRAWGQTNMYPYNWVKLAIFE